MRRLLVPVVIVGLIAGSAISAAAADDVEGDSRPDIDAAAMRAQWALDVGVSQTIADQAFDATTPILDFQLKHADDPRFGAVWTSFDDVFQVHVRYLAPSFDSEIELLERDLREIGIGSPVVRTTDGASYSELMSVVSGLTASDGPVPHYTINSQAGTVDVWGSSAAIEKLIDPIHVRQVPEPEPVRPEREAGADLAISGAGSCTVGYLWASGGTRGFVTAGHCFDSAAAINPSGYSTTAGVTVERCPSTGTDFQVDAFVGTPDLGNWSYSKSTASPPWPTFPFGIAGGFYPTQPSWKVGLGANSTRSTGGHILDYGSATYSGLDCPVSGTVNGIQYTNLSSTGDSGGPVFVQYNNAWLLLAIHLAGPTGGGAGTRTGIGVATTQAFLPGGAYICTASSGAC